MPRYPLPPPCIHAMNNLPRLLQGSVARATDVMPVVVLTGARQTGKSTLVRDLLGDPRAYFSLDDLEIRDQAVRAPADLVAREPRLTLDEAQRAPDLLFAIKQAVDRERHPGQFILTGSANLLLMRRVSESLAGRASYLTLWPMTRAEVLGLGCGGVWTELMEEAFESWLDLLHQSSGQPEDWRHLALRGGYPTPALELSDSADRAIWFEGYVRTYLERDLQDLSSINNLIDFRRLMLATSHRVGQLINQTELGRDVQFDRAPLAQPARDVVSTRSPSRVFGEPNEEAHENAEGVLVRHRIGDPSRRST